MPAMLKVLLPAVACAALLPAMAGCAPEANQFPPVCPRVAFLAPTADLAIYRPGSNGKDLTALMLAGRMETIGGKCKNGDKGTVEATVTVGASLARGPAMPGNQAIVPVYVAVVQGDQILDKRIYRLTASFPSNVDRVNVSTPPIFMVFPVSATRSAAAYRILAGFQLTEAQLQGK